MLPCRLHMCGHGEPDLLPVEPIQPTALEVKSVENEIVDRRKPHQESSPITIRSCAHGPAHFAFVVLAGLVWSSCV